MVNLLTRVPTAAASCVATLVRSIFAQPDADSAWTQYRHVVTQLEPRFAPAAATLEDAAHDLLAFTAFPKTHWNQTWFNNPQERLNRQTRRRTDVVGTFPNRAALVRLIGSVLAEQHDEWAVARRSTSVDSLTEARHTTAVLPTLPREMPQAATVQLQPALWPSHTTGQDVTVGSGRGTTFWGHRAPITCAGAALRATWSREAFGDVTGSVRLGCWPWPCSA